MKQQNLKTLLIDDEPDARAVLRSLIGQKIDRDYGRMSDVFGFTDLYPEPILLRRRWQPK